MFGMMETIYGFIRRQVGLRTDQASATGSLHAKVVELRSFLNGKIGNYSLQKTSLTLSQEWSKSLISEAGPSVAAGTKGIILGATLNPGTFNYEQGAAIQFVVNGITLGTGRTGNNYTPSMYEIVWARPGDWVFTKTPGIGQGVLFIPFNNGFTTTVFRNTTDAWGGSGPVISVIWAKAE